MKRMKNRSRSRSVRKLLLLTILIGAMALFTSCAKEENLGEDSTQVESSEIVEVEDTTHFAEGTTLGGQDISGKTLEEALALGRAYLDETLEALEISVKFREDTVLLKGTDYTYDDVLDLTLQEVLESREAGEYDIEYVVDLSEQGESKLNEKAQNCYQEGNNATVTGYDEASGAFTFSDETTGIRVDLTQTLEDIRNLLSQKQGGELEVEFIEVAPTLTKEYLAANFTEISNYSTVSTNTANGNSNMKLALSHVNGTILEPGDEFVYNTVIGDSTSTENGYLPAAGISSGALVQMIGGGICQGSTTVYGAAIRAGLEITERHNHGIQSTYCPIGQDAMVDYGNADLRFVNNYDTPIYIKSSMVDTTLYVSIYGVQPSEWDSIEIYSEQTATYAALTTVKYTLDYSLSAGQYNLASSGRQGASASASRTYYKDGAVVKTEALPDSYYPPAGTIYTYGPGTDTSKIGTSSSTGSTNTSTSSTGGDTSTSAGSASSTDTSASTAESSQQSAAEETQATEQDQETTEQATTDDETV